MTYCNFFYLNKMQLMKLDKQYNNKEHNTFPKKILKLRSKHKNLPRSSKKKKKAGVIITYPHRIKMCTLSPEERKKKKKTPRRRK